MQVQKQIDELLALRASEWLEVLPTATEAERTAFAQWLGESRLHVQEFLEIYEIDRQLGFIDPERQIDIEAILRDMHGNVVELPRREAATPAAPVAPLRVAAAAAEAAVANEPETAATARDHSARPKQRRWKIAAALAASIAVAALSGFLLLDRMPSTIATSVGEQRTVQLPDASIIEINVMSAVRVNLDETRRQIDLRYGEAIFTVAHDPERPFTVHTPAGTIQAVGTQFNVNIRPDGDTLVTVLEGRVKLAAKNAATGAVEFLDAGQEAVLKTDGTVQRSEVTVVPEKRVAWREKRLVFDKDTPIGEIVDQFNRYNRVPRLVLEGVSPTSRRYKGVFEAMEPETFASLLEGEPGLRVERRGDDIVVRERSPR